MQDVTTHKHKLLERLGIAITAQGLKQVQVAKATGFSAQRINNWLGGNHYPNQYFVYRFCLRYPITADYLYTGSVKGIDGPLADALLAAEVAFSEPSVDAENPLREKRKA